MRRLLVFVTLALLVAPASCAKFGADTNGNGGTTGSGPVTKRDLSVVVDWPKDALDPFGDVRASSLDVTLTDTTDPTRTVTQHAGKVRGPFAFAGFASSGRVDARVEVHAADGRLLSFGLRSGWDAGAHAEIPVAVRMRLLYFVSADRGAPKGQLRALGLTPAAAEPAMDETLDPLVSLQDPTGLAITRDALLLAEAGTQGSGGPGALRIFATATHVSSGDVVLPFSPAGVAVLGDSHVVLTAPLEASQSDVLAVVDLDAKTVDQHAVAAGGWIKTNDLTTAPAGDIVAVVGEYFATANKSKSTLWLVDAATRNVATVDLSTALQSVSGARFAADGRSLFVVGVAAQGGGAMLVLDTSAHAVTRTVPLTFTPAGILLHPDGKHGILNDADAGSVIVDLETGASVYTSPSKSSGPKFDIASAVRMPYAPFRVVGGQTDPGNNWDIPLSDFVDLSNGGAEPAFVPIDAAGDIGTAASVSTPFGQPL